MQRRDLLKMIAAVTGCAMVGVSVQAREQAPRQVMGEAETALLADVAEAILPQTDTPGAKAAGCGAVMALLVNECYPDAQQQLLKDGLLQLQALARAQGALSFGKLALSEQQQLLTGLDKVARNQQSDATNAGAPHFFTLLKQLSLFSFFTSKAGCTEVLRYVAVPGKYVGDLAYKKGDRAWAFGG